MKEIFGCIFGIGCLIAVSILIEVVIVFYGWNFVVVDTLKWSAREVTWLAAFVIVLVLNLLSSLFRGTAQNG